MKVFRIHNDINNFQSFLTEEEDDWEKLIMDCTKMIKQWSPPSVFIYQPKLLQGNFFNFDSGLLTCDPEATKTLRSYLEMAGELLPLPFEGKEYSILNVMECINCLNQEKTEWIYGKSTGSRISIKEYSFHPNRFSESVIFKIPETSKIEILVVEGLKDPEEELQFVVESTGLKGLIFELIWEGQLDESPHYFDSSNDKGLAYVRAVGRLYAFLSGHTNKIGGPAITACYFRQLQ